MTEQEYKDYVNNLRNRNFRCPEASLDMVHAIIGIAGEAGELINTLKKHLAYNQPLDTGNIKEELGDLLHYLTYILIEQDWSLEELMINNVTKLKRRYPNGYNNTDAKLRRDKE